MIETIEARKLATGDRMTQAGRRVVVGSSEEGEIFYCGTMHQVVFVTGLDIECHQRVMFAAVPDQTVEVARGV